LRIYEDNVIACGRIKRDLADAAEMASLDVLDQIANTRQISMESSRWSQREIARTRNEAVRSQLTQGLVGTKFATHDHIVLGFDNQQTDPFGGYISNPLVTDIIDNNIYSTLTKIPLKDLDAKHLMVAICNGYDRFLTTDPDFISSRSQIEAAFPIKVLKPSELVAELASAGIRP
jgi:hypothetical protein